LGRLGNAVLCTFWHIVEAVTFCISLIAAFFGLGIIHGLLGALPTAQHSIAHFKMISK
jgi:uncharacterized membrane protein